MNIPQPKFLPGQKAYRAKHTLSGYTEIEEVEITKVSIIIHSDTFQLIAYDCLIGDKTESRFTGLFPTYEIALKNIDVWIPKKWQQVVEDADVIIQQPKYEVGQTVYMPVSLWREDDLVKQLSVYKHQVYAIRILVEPEKQIVSYDLIMENCFMVDNDVEESRIFPTKKDAIQFLKPKGDISHDSTSAII